MIVSLVVAVAQNGVIGRDNQLPWHLPEDLKYFKRVTMGKPIVMGRKTYESIGKPLPGRTNIVITRNTGYAAQGVEVVHTLNESIALCVSLVETTGVEEVMVIGGGEIFSETLQLADRIYLTRIHADVEGDAYFPVFDETLWQEITALHFSADDTNPYDYSFLVLERKKPV